MTMGETYGTDRDVRGELPVETCCVVRQRRNAMWNIFEGVESAVQERLTKTSVEMVQRLVVGTAHDTVPESLPHLAHSDPLPSSSSTTLTSEGWCDPARLQRSFSTPAAEEMQAALQNRQRRNAVGNLFDLLTPSQQLLMVEHLQELMGHLHGDVSDDDCQTILPLADLSSTTSSSSSSTVSTPRSQGEIVCR